MKDTPIDVKKKMSADLLLNREALKRMWLASLNTTEATGDKMLKNKTTLARFNRGIRPIETPDEFLTPSALKLEFDLSECEDDKTTIVFNADGAVTVNGETVEEDDSDPGDSEDPGLLESDS